VFTLIISDEHVWWDSPYQRLAPTPLGDHAQR